jgi:3-oxoacyl-[acyl-carrier-protein] synthase II
LAVFLSILQRIEDMDLKRVAVTGFGVVSPIGTGREAFWDSLSRGISGISRITHFDASTFEVQLAGEVKEELVLPEPVLAVSSEDPKVGFAYEACTEALFYAGIVNMDDRTLLHIGTSLEIFNLGKVVHQGKPDFKAVAVQSLKGNGPPLQMPLDIASNLIAKKFGRPGQVLTNCSACAAGAQAIGHGFHAIRSGRFEVAVCGGFDSMINPLGVGGFQLLGALTTDNTRGAKACRPFDSARRGTVLGEGAAIVVLEPLEKAKAEGKEILAEMSGFGSTLDAYNLSAPDPEGDGAAQAMTQALRDAGISPPEVHHINTHGTGTQLNDEVEAKAIRRLFADTWEKIPVTATKSMTGHLIAAAGPVELGACLLVLHKGVLPPNASLEHVGQGCELNHVSQPGAQFNGEYVLTNSFGFGGQNASLVLRKYHG